MLDYFLGDAHPHKNLFPSLLHCRIEVIEGSPVMLVEHTGFYLRRHNRFYSILVSDWIGNHIRSLNMLVKVHEYGVLKMVDNEPVLCHDY